MTDTEKILDKLGKIKRHMDSAKEIGNEAEAQAFAGMLQNLLLRHKLEMTDINYQKEMQSEPIVEQRPETIYDMKRGRVYKDFPDVEVVGQRREWAERLADIVSNAYSCRFLVVQGSSIIYFVGHKSNVAMVEYLYLTMLRAADKMSSNAAKKQRAAWRQQNGGAGMTPRGFRESWLRGFCERIGQRMKEEREKFNNPTQSTALVRVDKEALAVLDYMNKFRKMASRVRGPQHFNDAGYSAGKNAANGLNLNRPLNAGGPNRQLN
jgi:hypothetical protein